MSQAAEITSGRENGRSRPRGYTKWNPQKKSRVLLAAVEAVLEEYEAHLPMTVRQIFYRLVGTIGYPKDENAYARLCELLVRARRARLIPFESIRDDGEVTYVTEWFHGPEDFWDATGRRIKEYRRDRQAGQAQRLELWCEAAGMLPQLARVADKFSVPVFSAGGFASLTATRRIAHRALERGVPTILLHVGDYDPSGESIFQAMTADAAAFVEADRPILTQRIVGVRVALTADQVEEHHLPTAPPKGSDGRSRSWRGATCQLEALPPDTLAELVRDAIVSRLSEWWLNFQVQAERGDRAELYLGLPRGSE
jgi:hypothetical protein